MVRKLLKIVSVLFIIAVIVMLTIYYALFVAVSHTGVRYETLASAKIPEAMNDVKIAYFTDLEYGFSIDEQRLRDIVDTINHNAATSLRVPLPPARKIEPSSLSCSRTSMPRWASLPSSGNATAQAKRSAPRSQIC